MPLNLSISDFYQMGVANGRGNQVGGLATKLDERSKTAATLAPQALSAIAHDKYYGALGDTIGDLRTAQAGQAKTKGFTDLAGLITKLFTPDKSGRAPIEQFKKSTGKKGANILGVDTPFGATEGTDQQAIQAFLQLVSNPQLLQMIQSQGGGAPLGTSLGGATGIGGLTGTGASLTPGGGQDEKSRLIALLQSLGGA